MPAGGREEEVADAAPASRVAERRGRVLVVDDAPENASALAELLSRAGYDVEAATSGPEALRAAAACAPDLVLLDVVMPGMNGFQACRRLKALPGCGDVPVIFVSALSEVDAKVLAFDAGGVDHVVKPFDHREVLARVQAQVSLRLLRRSLAERNAQLERTVAELEAALAQVQALRGLLPICAHCKGIRDDQGYWHRVEAYIEAHSPAHFTHGICPRCLELHYPAPPDVDEEPEGA